MNDDDVFFPPPPHPPFEGGAWERIDWHTPEGRARLEIFIEEAVQRSATELVARLADDPDLTALDIAHAVVQAEPGIREHVRAQFEDMRKRSTH